MQQFAGSLVPRVLDQVFAQLCLLASEAGIGALLFRRAQHPFGAQCPFVLRAGEPVAAPTCLRGAQHRLVEPRAQRIAARLQGQ
ncbi:MAG: hypothetical protein NTV19_05880 [Burkholderiales bacterium]|nr:hypothetical protein [Burkholderiales bacterium]